MKHIAIAHAKILQIFTTKMVVACLHALSHTFLNKKMDINHANLNVTTLLTSHTYTKMEVACHLVIHPTQPQS